MTTWTYLSNTSNLIDVERQKTLTGWKQDIALPLIAVLGFDVYRGGLDVVVGDKDGHTATIPVLIDQETIIEFACQLLLLAGEADAKAVLKKAGRVTRYIRSCQE